MKYSNFNKNYLIIFKLLLCLYILLSPYINHYIFLEFINDGGIKTLYLLLIVYFIEVDYIISILLSICLIIIIILHNKDNIEIIKKEIIKKEVVYNLKNNTEKKELNQNFNNEDILSEQENNINNIIITEQYIADDSGENLEKIQTNIFNEKNNLVYFSGNYSNSLVTIQGELELIK